MKLFVPILCLLAATALGQVNAVYSGMRVTTGMAFSTNAAPANLAPMFTTDLTNQTVTVGSNAQFSVAASGTGTLGFRWLTNSVFEQDGGRFTTTNTAGGSTLYLAGVGTNDNGMTVQCVCSNAYGSTTGAVATLTVSAPASPVSLTMTRIGEQTYWYGGSTITITTTNGVSVGEGIVVFCWGTGSGPSGATDSAANSYLSVTNGEIAGAGVSAFVSKTSSTLASGQTITLNVSGAQGRYAVAYKLSALAASPLDSGANTSNDSGGTTTVTNQMSGSISGTDDIVFSLFESTNSKLFIEASSFTELSTTVPADGNVWRCLITYKRLTSGTAMDIADRSTDQFAGYIGLIFALKLQ